MRVFNQNKTRELTEYDLSKGYLKDDIITIHYNEVQEVQEVGHYETIAEYSNGGKDVKWVVDVKGVEYQPARDEIENVLVYIPFTQSELTELHLKNLRQKRELILKAFDVYKTNVSYGIYNESVIEHNEIVAWYQSILDLDETAINNVPNVIERYIDVNMRVYDSKGDIQL